MSNRGDDEDYARYQRELAAQRAKQQQLERNAVAAFGEWLGELAKQFVKRTVNVVWDWLQRLFK